ncbi:hypothetical protein F5J12DRAFT_425723 [Pisolithus orientalis]|uniref:uncharacterized protein n=1 Tax=Pisolithus orientalis TaxID=936130 RepID=UPI0022244812|nr:uncharacterized protein F5J12DRAFT_425723 [Pisolithus orientalis]KAI5980428.1 hypothetical protein F5J12DRAFT_425723 [Pisolithus orientalis]
MRLLDVKGVLDREKVIQETGAQIKIFENLHDRSEKYAVPSHRWGKDEDEVNYDEMTQLMGMAEPARNEIRRRAGYEKIIKSCEQAKKDGYRWIWIDTCCIDKRSGAELSEAINSMYQWYQESQKCYAHLNGVCGTFFPREQDLSKFAKANGWPEWFSRGWTLQELIAPKQVEFFNKDWVPIGDKGSLAETLEKITRIPINVLRDGVNPRHFCVAQLMSWAADRKTTRVEDRAYSLLGLFGVDMPKFYGEGKKAFQRLQLEIIQRYYCDHSIFAWNSKRQFGWLGDVLADDPSYFRGCHDVEKVELNQFVDEIMNYPQNRLGIARSPGRGSLVCLRSRGHTFRQQLAVFPLTNVGIQICLPVIPHRDSESVFRAILACRDYYGNLITIDFKSL